MENKILVWELYLTHKTETMYIIKHDIYPVLLYVDGCVYNKVLKFILAHPTLLDFDPFIPYIGLSHDMYMIFNEHLGYGSDKTYYNIVDIHTVKPTYVYDYTLPCKRNELNIFDI